METVLVIGAADGQLPLVQSCKKRGFKVIVASINGNYPCFDYADKIYYIDVRNKEEIYDAVKNDGITIVTSDQLDIAVPTVAYLSEKLGLKSIGYDCALKFQNKYIMKNEAKKIGINVPAYFVVKTLQEALNKSYELSFPIIIKPVDAQGSWGVIKIHNIDELKEMFENSIIYSKSKEIIMEEFIEGDEYIVEAFNVEGRCHLLCIGKSSYFNLHNSCVPSSRIFKSVTDANCLEKNILSTHKKIVENFNLSFGMSHGEYLYNKEKNKIYLCEVAARGGGVNISSEIVPLITGKQNEELLIDCLEEKKLIFNDKEQVKYAGYICFYLPEGEIYKVAGIEQLKSINGVYSVNIKNLQIGAPTRKILDKGGRYGPIVFFANNLDDCRRIMNKIKDTLNISIKTKFGIKNIIWR